MFLEVVEYIDSLAVLGGKRWMKGDASVGLLTNADREIILTVKLGQIKDDEMLAKALYGPSGRVDFRYRRRLARFEKRLADIVLSCSLVPSLGKRRLDSIEVFRDMAIGQTLLRAATAPVSSRIHLLAARRGMIYPELVWYAPPLHLALAFDDALSRKGRVARIELERGREAAYEALEVFNLHELWVDLTIPLRKKADKLNRKPVIVRARALLAHTARRKMSAVVAIAAARLATTLSQLENDPVLGLRWLDRSREALIREDRFDHVAEREYLTQRAFIFNSSHNYAKGVEAAKKVVEASPEDSSYWFNAMHILLHLQLKKSEYTNAVETAERLVSRKSLNRQSAVLAARIRLRSLYAQLLTYDKTVSMRHINTHKRYPLDMLVMHVMHALQHKRTAVAIESIHSLTRHIDRTKLLKKDRALWLLSWLLKVYANNGLSLRASRQNPSFVRYETELHTHKTMATEHTVVSPLQIWKVIIVRR